ncbi:hypothetical protein J3E69DRAFT_49038 [Trichoderma sp. SZMC 28015]
MRPAVTKADTDLRVSTCISPFSGLNCFNPLQTGPGPPSVPSAGWASDKSPERRLLLALGLTLCAQAASWACGSAAWASRRRKEKTCRGWPHHPIIHWTRKFFLPWQFPQVNCSQRTRPRLG